MGGCVDSWLEDVGESWRRSVGMMGGRGPGSKSFSSSDCRNSGYISDSSAKGKPWMRRGGGLHSMTKRPSGPRLISSIGVVTSASYLDTLYFLLAMARLVFL